MSLTYVRTITPLISEETFPVFFPNFFEAITCFLPFAAWELVAFIVNFGKFFPSNIWIFDAFNQLAQFCRLVLGKFDFCPLVQLFNMLFQAVSLQPGIGVACTSTFWGKELHRIVAWGLLSFLSFWRTQFAFLLQGFATITTCNQTFTAHSAMPGVRFIPFGLHVFCRNVPNFACFKVNSSYWPINQPHSFGSVTQLTFSIVYPYQTRAKYMLISKILLR